MSTNMDITREFSVDYAPIGKKEFAKYIKEKREENNEALGLEMSTRDLGTIIGIDYEMFRKILNQQKPTKKRDCIIAICVALDMYPGDIDYALGLYQYMPALDEENPRDRFIKSQIAGNLKISVAELNKRLIQFGFPGLDIQDKRSSKKKTSAEDVIVKLPYKVLELKVRTPIDNDYYYGDPYDSLCTTYDPSRCRSTGDMLIGDSSKKEYYHLTASTDGYMSSSVYRNGGLPTSYKSLEECGIFKDYFIELHNTIALEKERLLSILKDTKNYQHRASARLINDKICVFYEEFNYIMPELNEYYVMSYASGKYILRVYNESAFMIYYLISDEYKRYYGDCQPEPIETYESLEQIEHLLSSVKKNSPDNARYRMRKKAFERIKPSIDTLLSDIKAGNKYIQNLNAIYDYPEETLKYYDVEAAFQCTYNEEFGDIIGYSDAADFTSESGATISITLQDIFKAFEYGFPNINEIYRIKEQYGSIEAVLS